MAGLTSVHTHTMARMTTITGRKAAAGTWLAISAPAAAPTKAATAIGSAVRTSGRALRQYVAVAAEVPMIELSLLVASAVTGAAVGKASSSAGSCSRPPPPDTASTQPAAAGGEAQRR